MQGANHTLAAGGPVSIVVDWTHTPDELDIACFLVRADGKVASDEWMVFYNQPASPGKAAQVQLDGNAVTFQIDLDGLPADIVRCCFTATLDGTGTVADIQGLTLRACAAGTQIRFVPAQLGKERALMMAELYRHGGGWKVRAVAQGFDGGLAPLARHFGVSVEEGAGNALPLSPPAPAATVDMRKVTLDKPAQSTPINLGKKKDGTIEHIVVRMDWTSAVDLDLHAFYRLKSGAQGEVNFMEEGSLERAPYICIDDDMGVDDVAGDHVEHLTLSRIDTLESVIFVANIFRDDDEEPESFAQYDGKVTLTTSLGEIVVPLTSKVPGNWAVIAKLENIDRPRLVNINQITRHQPMLADY
jgi:tellurite resistance protein TerA